MRIVKGRDKSDCAGVARRKISTDDAMRMPMAKRKQSSGNNTRSRPSRKQTAGMNVVAEPASDPQISSSTLSLHELFEQQARQLLDRADLGEEQKQNILVAMSCPCCGAGAMSYTAKLKR
jgi:hypothetical protein